MWQVCQLITGRGSQFIRKFLRVFGGFAVYTSNVVAGLLKGCAQMSGYITRTYQDYFHEVVFWANACKRPLLMFHFINN